MLYLFPLTGRWTIFKQQVVCLPLLAEETTQHANPLPSVGSAQRLRFASTLHKSTVYNRARDLHRSKANHHSPGDKMIPNVHTSSKKNTKYIHTCVHHARVFSRKTERQMAVSHVIRLGVVFRGIPPPTAAIHVQKSLTHIHFGSMRSTSQAVS